MEQLFLIFLFALLLLVVALLKPKIPRGSSDRNALLPPSPSVLPIIGHLHHLVAGGSLRHQVLRNLATRHGPLMFLRLGHVDFAIVSSREAAHEVLRTHDLCFASRPEITRFRIVTYGYRDIAIAPYGHSWRQLRKIIITELLNARRVATFASIRKEAVSDLVDGIASSATASFEGKAEVNLRLKLQETINDIVTMASFSRECRPGQKAEFLRIMGERLSLTSGFSVADLFPSLEFVDSLLGVKARMEKNFKGLDRILNELIAEHEERMRLKKEANSGVDSKDPGEAQDLLDVLLLAQSDQSISIENVKAVAMDMFIAGTETSSSAVQWAMAELMRNPGAMGKAQREVRRAANGRRRIEERDLDELSYLKHVIKETLRLHPPVPLLLPRLCRETCRIQGYTIPAGTRLLVNVWALGRDPLYWEHPERFWPERFEGSSVDFRGGNFEFLPFGAGRRICPGMNFGLANVELPLAQLLHCFDWELPGGMNPEALDMTEKEGATVGKKTDLCLLATQHLA